MRFKYKSAGNYKLEIAKDGDECLFQKTVKSSIERASEGGQGDYIW